MRKQICLMTSLIFLFLLSIIVPCFSDTYSNKDIDTMKKTGKKDSSGTLVESDSKVYKNSDVKCLKTSDKNQSYQRKGNKKISTAPKSDGKVQYQSTDGSMKIEVTSKSTISNKDVQQMKSTDKNKSYDRAVKAGSEDDESSALKLPVKITELPIAEKMLPWQEWSEEYKDYFFNHYDDESLELAPKVIVIRSTYAGSASDVIDLFKRGSLYHDGDDGYTYGHLSTHFILDRGGEIIQTLPLNVRSRGAYGVNHLAITIELVGASTSDLLKDDTQKKALYSLVSVLMRKFSIPLNKVYGHHEVAQGKSVVPEYTEFNDNDYPTCYPPDNECYDPGHLYMQGLRSFFAKQTGNAKQ